MPSIPKVVHMIWIGPAEPPWPAIDTWRQGLLAAHAGWEVRLWRDADIEAFGLVNQMAFASRHCYAGRADVARYEILNRHGGVYVDADSVWLGRPLDPLLARATDTGFFAAFEGNPNLLVNGFFGAVAGHPILTQAVAMLAERARELAHEPDWIATGPALFAAAYHRACTAEGGAAATIVSFEELIAKSWVGLQASQIAADLAHFRTHSDSLSYQLGWTTNGFTAAQLNGWLGSGRHEDLEEHA